MNGRLALAAMLSAGFMFLIGLSMFTPIPETAQRIVDASMGALAVALGHAISGIYKTDLADEQRAKNTGAAFDAVSEAIRAQPPKHDDTQ